MLYVHFRQEKVKFCNIMAKLCQNRRHNFRHNVGKFDIFCLEMYSQHSFRNVTVTFSPIMLLSLIYYGEKCINFCYILMKCIKKTVIHFALKCNKKNTFSMNCWVFLKIDKMYQKAYICYFKINFIPAQFAHLTRNVISIG